MRLGLLTPRFMEFEAEEEMQIQKLQWVKLAQGLPPAAPPKPEPRGPPAPDVGPQPGTAPTFPWQRVAHGSGGRGKATVPLCVFSFKWTLVFRPEQPPRAWGLSCPLSGRVVTW